MKPALIVLLASITLSGCALTSERPPMRLDMPADYRAEAPVATVALTQDWWRSFESSELAGLIDLALRDSPDLGMAVERVRQAEAQVRIAGSSLFPQLDLSASTNRRRTDPDRGSAVTTESTSATLSASYEIDAWGRNASGRRAAEALLDLSRFDEESLRLTTVAGVANAYFQVLSLRGRLEVARENLAIAERVLDIVQIRARNGVVSQLDVARQNSAVLSQRAAIPALALQERQTLAALAILVGQPPQHFDVKGADVGDVAVPVVAPGLPAELLVRRPDLAAAEAQLVAANANLAAARAALLPSLQLTTSAGLANNALLSLANPSSTVYNFGASMLQSIFDGGRLRAQRDIAESRERELVESYRAAILSALADVEDALAATARTAEQQNFQAAALEEARRALRLAEVRYREGADDLLSVLDAQRTLFSAEDQVALTRLARLQASVSLYTALGGGWEMPARMADAAP
ncbi:MAG TPA: efflux transporter outer membrane subunit [Burkholderiales bacterium]|nr:efflux transporter outer membrane subunit [Burkholderiales bacterium]